MMTQKDRYIKNYVSNNKGKVEDLLTKAKDNWFVMTHSNSEYSIGNPPDEEAKTEYKLNIVLPETDEQLTKMFDTRREAAHYVSNLPEELFGDLTGWYCRPEWVGNKLIVGITEENISFRGSRPFGTVKKRGV